MAKEITREELKKSLRHYWRMRKWAKKQDFRETPDWDIMEEKLGETWSSEYCILCEGYGNEYIKTCPGCPLYENKKGCVCDDDSAWRQMQLAETWEEWITACANMAIVIMKLPREKS